MFIELIERLINEHAIAIIAILVSAYLARKIMLKFATKIIRRAVHSQHKYSSAGEVKREETLISIINTALRVGIWAIAGFMILQELGVNIAPLLAGAGVIGLALGFGAQSLVKDGVTGLFIIFENQYRVGDYVMINNDFDGVVEKITLRATVMRDLDGMVHHVSNGTISLATNMTMEYSSVNVDVGVSYDTNLDQVEKIINQTGEALAQDDQWNDSIIEPPRFLRVDKFGDSAIIIKILGKTTADARWAVAGELRKRLKQAFDKHGIEIPFPQRVLHDSRGSSKPKQP